MCGNYIDDEKISPHIVVLLLLMLMFSYQHNFSQENKNFHKSRSDDGWKLTT